MFCLRNWGRGDRTKLLGPGLSSGTVEDVGAEGGESRGGGEADGAAAAQGLKLRIRPGGRPRWERAFLPGGFVQHKAHGGEDGAVDLQEHVRVHPSRRGLEPSPRMDDGQVVPGRLRQREVERLDEA